jgi:hypothetical protein
MTQLRAEQRDRQPLAEQQNSEATSFVLQMMMLLRAEQRGLQPVAEQQ